MSELGRITDITHHTHGVVRGVRMQNLWCFESGHSPLTWVKDGARYLAEDDWEPLNGWDEIYDKPAKAEEA